MNIYSRIIHHDYSLTNFCNLKRAFNMPTFNTLLNKQKQKKLLSFFSNKESESRNRYAKFKL